MYVSTSKNEVEKEIKKIEQTPRQDENIPLDVIRDRQTN